ncbi:Multidrug resistance protein pgp-3 [Parelaphostrongylus tenuis]|uniref:Multidrug resistance protein pgp-3 n=1 Tax=Parelaphostrongylus tenuis TaxID=148309 RepID=A0AAD5MLJ6_PARTN|nr:Multidrug resistance protein pgp-3 [Parelaphostrongylus tenuis]
MRQDVSYFDDPKHNTGNLTTRLASDAPNVQAAIDQRLAEVMQGICALITGIIVAFCFGWNMALCGLATAVILVIAQSSVAQYLKFRGQKDTDSAIEASRSWNAEMARQSGASIAKLYSHIWQCVVARCRRFITHPGLLQLTKKSFRKTNYTGINRIQTIE